MNAATEYSSSPSRCAVFFVMAKLEQSIFSGQRRPRTLKIESPVISTPESSCRYDAWPGECPGVCTTRIPPANGTTCPSVSSSPTVTFSTLGSGSLRNSLPTREVGSTSGWVPVRTYSASSAWMSTGRPVSRETWAAPPAWSGWQWVSISRVTSLGPDPIDRRAAITLLPEEPTPMSISVTWSSSSRSMKPLT